MVCSTGRTIQLFFVKGDPGGMVTARIPFQWSGHILISRRTEIRDALNRPEANGSGVYFLVDEEKNKVYIGESDELGKRISRHVENEKMDWWSTAILITSTSTEDKINKAHGKYLEYRLIEKTNRLGKIDLANIQKPNEQSLSESDTASMDAFLENIYLVLPALKFDFLTDQTKFRSPQENNLTTDDIVRFELIQLNGKISARARLENGQFIVEAGSQVREKWMAKDYEDSGYAKLFHDLIRQGILIKKDNFCEFSKDYIFNSPSAAASVATGHIQSGPKFWKLEGSKKTYAEWENDTLKGKGF